MIASTRLVRINSSRGVISSLLGCGALIGLVTVRNRGRISNAAGENGKIRWIDYLLSISRSGDTLHLHICPAGKWDTDIFAYNFIKRGFKHGIRLVGSMKSEPDMNVLAVFDR